MSQTAITAAPKATVAPKRRPSRLLTVSAARRITPNMIRVTLTTPEDGQSSQDFATQLAAGRDR